MASPINPAELFSVKGMVALVTGGGTGIGLMIVRALVAGGASKVYIAGRRLDVLQKAAASTANPEVVVPLTCDVTSTASLTAVVDHITKDAGYLNLLVCNSGISGPQAPAPPPTGADGQPPSLEEWRTAQLAVPVDDYLRPFAVNATSVWYTTMACLSLLDLGNKDGHDLGWSSQVLVTSSIAGFNRKAPGGFAYGQSKAATTLAVKHLAGVLPTWGIRVNALAPGLFPSEMSADIVKGLGGDVNGSGVIPVDKNAVPLGRTGDEKDMAGTLLWMVSRAGAYCNGNVVVIDGGRLGVMPSTY